MRQPKVAIFYDWLNQWGGAEKVLLDILKIYPEAPIYTLVHDTKNTPWLPINKKIYTSFINRLPKSFSNPIIYTPLYSIALEQFDFSNYDIVISTTSTIGHSLLTQPQTLHVCYMHNTNRYIYQTPSSLKFLNPILNLYKSIDTVYSQRPDHIICNSKTVKNRIKNNYNLSAKIIYPGIDTAYFKPTTKPVNQKFFLVVSRLVPHKKIDLSIQACHQLNLPLIIIGNGRQKK